MLFRSLGTIVYIEALPDFVKLAKDGPWHIRAAVFEALGNYKDVKEEVFPILVKGLEDEDSFARRFVAKSLDKLGWKPETEEQEIVYLIAKKEWESLTEKNRELVIPALKKLLGYQDIDVRQIAGQTLKNFGINVDIPIRINGDSKNKFEEENLPKILE